MLKGNNVALDGYFHRSGQIPEDDSLPVGLATRSFRKLGYMTDRSTAVDFATLGQGKCDSLYCLSMLASASMREGHA
jgi:hypothetical protein